MQCAMKRPSRFGLQFTGLFCVKSIKTRVKVSAVTYVTHNGCKDMDPKKTRDLNELF